ncbi:hypothetical protein ACLKA7_011838 [Drosophila subpalustris]
MVPFTALHEGTNLSGWSVIGFPRDCAGHFEVAALAFAVGVAIVLPAASEYCSSHVYVWNSRSGGVFRLSTVLAPLSYKDLPKTAA